jgi:hypothetical protein
MPNWTEYSGTDNGMKKKIEIKQCTDWNWGDVNDCKNNAPSETKRWIACGLGSSPGGVKPGTAAACSQPSKSKDDFTCMWGQECYAITKEEDRDVKWGELKSGCDGDGRTLTMKICNDWLDNDVNSCKNSNTKGDVKNWIACGIGSSPGGIYPGKRDRACSPLSKGPGDFTCMWGQDCYAITENVDDKSCKKNFLSNPGGAIVQGVTENVLNPFNDTMERIKYVIIILIILSISSSFLGIVLRFM